MLQINIWSCLLDMNTFGFALIWIFVFSIPFENLFVFEGIGTVGRLVGLISFSISIFILVGLKKFRIFSIEHWSLYLFFIWSLLTCTWSINLDQSFSRCLTYCQLMLMIWLIWNWTREDESVETLLKAFIFGSYVSIFVTIYNFLLDNQVVWQRYAATGFDPNELGLMIALGIPISWHLSFATSTRFRFLFKSYIAFAWIAILLTASRAAFICAIIASTYVILLFHRLPLKSKLLLIMMAFCLISTLLTYIPDSSLSRIASISAEISTGTLNKRTKIWKAGIDVLADNMLVGTGIGTYSTAVKDSLNGSTVAHNTFLTIAVEQGVIGFLFFFIYIMIVIHKVIQMPVTFRNYWLVVLLVWSIGVMTLTWDGKKITWLLLTLPLAQAQILKCKARTQRLDNG